MAYKKYIKRGNKTFGPYVYHSKKINGKVISEYRGKFSEKNKKKINTKTLVVALFSIILLLSLLLISNGLSERELSQSFNSIRESLSKSFHSLTGLTVLDSDASESEQTQETSPEIPIQEQENVTDNNFVNETTVNTTSENQTQTNETSNQTSTKEIPSSNETLINEPEVNTTNETTPNETLANVTEQNITIEANVTVSTIQYQAVLNQPVKWKKEITPKISGNLTILLPQEAENIAIKKIKENKEEVVTSQTPITGAVVGDSKSFLAGFFKKITGAITGRVIEGDERAEKEIKIEIDELEADYEIEYETPAPYAEEEELKQGKLVRVVGPEDIHYENVLIFTNLSESLNIKDVSKVKIKWVEQNIFVNPEKIQDTNANGVYDYVEWIAPQLSNQTFELIIITKAEHLDSNRNFISDIYEEVKTLDDIWSEEIPDQDYVRVTFEKNLTSTNDITLYPRIISGNPRIDVYEINQSNLIAEFTNLNSSEYNKIFLTNLAGQQDTFDLKVFGGSVEFDHIVDPTIFYSFTDSTLNTAYWGQPLTSTRWIAGTVASATEYTNLNSDNGVYAFIGPIAGGNGNDYPFWRFNFTINETTDRITSINVSFNGYDNATAEVGIVYVWNYTSGAWLTVGNVPASDGVISALYTSGFSDIIGSTNKHLVMFVEGPLFDVGEAILADFPSVNVTTESTPPKWFNNQTNSTLAGTSVLHSINWTDNVNLSGYIFSFNNGTGTFTNDSFVGMIGVSNWSNVTKVVNYTGGTTIQWMIYANDSSGNLNVTSTFSYVTTVDNPPKSQNPSTNNSNPLPGATVRHNINWTDDIALSFAKLEINSTGVSCNTAANITNTSLSGTSNWANLTWTLNESCEGKTIGWKQYANDSTNQWNVTDLQTYTVQNVNPTITLPAYTNATKYQNTQNMIFNISVSDTGVGASYCAINVNGNANQTLAVSSGWCNGTYALTDLTDGNKTINAYANDTLGNTALNNSFVVWIDTTAPTITLPAYTNATKYQNTQNMIFNISVSDSGVGASYCAINVVGGSNQTVAVSSGWCNGTYALTGIADGNKTINAYANDSAGNTALNNSFVVWIDTTVPTINLPVYTNATKYKNTQNMIFNISVSDSGVGASYCSINVDGQTNQTLAVSSGWCNGTYALTGIADGNKTINAYANDTLGNTALNNSYVVWIDSTAPTASFGTNPVDNYNSSSSSITFDLKIFDNLAVNGLSLYGNWTGTWHANQTNSSPINDTFWNVTVTGIPEGKYIWAAWGNDTAGNSAFTTTNRTITIDLTNPISTINAPENNTWTNDNIPDINFTLTDNFDPSIAYNLYVNGSINKTGSISNNTATNVTLDAQPEGLRLIISEASDDAGRKTNSSALYLKIDSIIPQIQFITGTEANATSPNRNWVFANVSVTETNFKNITYTLQNSSGIVNQTTYTSLVTEINWTSLLNENVQYQYNVSIYDQANNLNQTETKYITLISNQAPSVTVLYPANTTYNTNISQLNYSATDDSSVSYCWYSLDAGVTNSTPNAACQNFTGLTSNEGSNVWMVYANDSAGLEDSDSVIFTKDTSFPQFANYLRNPSTPNEDQNIQVNITVTETNKDSVILEFNNGTARNYTVTTNNSNEYFFTITSGNYTAHDSITYYWYANDTAGNMNKSAQQSFSVANQISSVSAPAINDTTPETNDLISCNGGTFSDNDAEDTEQSRYFIWYDDDAESSGQNSQTLSLSVSGLNRADVIKCSIRVYDGFDNSSWVNSSNTATIQNSLPVITNPLVSISWNANGSAFTYDYDATDADSDILTWYDNTTLFDINQTGYISDIPTESEAGTYAIRISSSDSVVNTTDDFTYTINDVTPPSIQFVSFTETNGSQLTRNYIQVNVTASDANGIGIITLRLYNSTSLVQTNTSGSSPLFVNFTNLPDEFYYFNATVNDSAGNANQTGTQTVSTDTGAPAINYASPTENSGIIRSRNYVQINVTASDPNLDKIIIRLYNSSNSQINTSISGTSPNFINFTGLADGLYFYNSSANDTFGNSNPLETRNITLDTTNPSISSLTESPSDPQTYSQTTIYVFNATITDTSLNTTLIEFDGVNYTPSQSGNIFNYTTSNLSAGIHTYYWYANDSAGNANKTADQTYTINNATGNITLFINNSAQNQAGNYGIQTNVSASTLYGTITLYKNGTDLTSQNNGYVTLAVGYYNYTAVSNGDQNHSSASTSLFATISKVQSEINLTLNGTRNNITIIQDSTVPINLSTITGDSGATLKLYNNGTLINQGSSPLGNQTTFNQVGVFNITGIYNGSENYTADSETWWANVTEAPDVTNPSVTSLTEYPTDPVTYSTDGFYQFNATITDNRQLHTLFINFNGTNYTPVNLGGNIYSFNRTGLAVGDYSYRWFANDTTGNVNNTENATYVINKAIPILTLSISPSTSVTYFTETIATGSNCPSQLTCNMYRNGVSTTNPETITLGVGTYNYTFNTTGNANYTSTSTPQNLTINQGTGNVFAYLNNSRANITIEQYTLIYLNGTLESGAGTIKLYNNGTLINQGASPLNNLTNFTAVGSYNITAIYDGNANYTADSETWGVIVIELDVTPPNISIIYPTNTSYTSVQTQLNYTATDNFGLSSCWYTLNNGITNATITCGQNISNLNSGQGSSTWKVYANDSKGNLNSSNITFFVDSVAPTISFALPVEISGDSLSRNYIQVNITASDTNLNTITVRLYNSSGSQIRINYSASSPFFINYTGLSLGNYSFNATANDTLNNQNSTETRTMSLITPTLTIIKPENKTYLTDTNLELNFSGSNYDSIWYNIDSGDNITITANTTFDTPEGGHILYLYANNSNGETAKNITFTVNATKFIVKYENYYNNGSSTDFNSSPYEDLQNLSGIILENTGYGKIRFNEAINITNDLTNDDNQVDLDTNTNISFNRIEINSTALSNFNKSATLYLYGLTFSNPRVLKDGEVCPSTICIIQISSGGTLIFNVTHFTSYSAEETPVEPTGEISAGEANRGGGLISKKYECVNDSQCKGDKVCWKHECVKLFDVKITDFKSPVKLGDFFEFTYFIKGQADINSDVVVDFWIEKDGKKVTSGSDTIYLGSFEEKTETTKIFLPTTLQSGVYQFFVKVNHEKYQAQSYRTIQIQVKDGIATINPVKADTKLYIIFGLVVLVLVLLSIIYLRKDRQQDSVLEKKSLVAQKMRKKEPQEEKTQIRYLFQNLLMNIKVVLLRIKYGFTSIKAKYEAGIYKAKIQAIEEELEEEIGILRSIWNKVHVAFLRIKYGITSIKPKYEAGIYKKEISSLRRMPEKVLKIIVSKAKGPKRYKNKNKKNQVIKPIESKKEPKPKTPNEIIEELIRRDETKSFK